MILDLTFIAKFCKHILGFVLESRSIDVRGLLLWVNGTEQ